MKKKIVFLGNHNVGFECLNYLIKSGNEIVCVVVNDKHKSKKFWYKSVARLAKDNGLWVVEAKELRKNSIYQRVKGLKPDLLLSVSFNHLVPAKYLTLPSGGAYNLHGSYLPDYKGRFAPVWSILNGESYCGVSLHKMTSKVDRGKIVDRNRIKITPQMTAYDLFMLQIPYSLKILKKNLKNICRKSTAYLNIDNSQGSYYSARKKSENRVCWAKSSTEIDRLVRAAYFPPYNFSYCFCEKRKIFIKKVLIRDDINYNITAGKIIDILDGCPLVSTGSGSCLILDSSIKSFKKGDILK